MRVNDANDVMTIKPDDILYGALKLYQPHEGTGPRVNADTILLAHFARPKGRDKVIELGCAQGAVSLILAMRRKHKRQGCEKRPHDMSDAIPKTSNFTPIDALDINPDLIELAKKNAELNGLSDDVSFFVSDLREHRKFFPSGAYDVAVMNPPYDEPGRSRPSPNDAMALALHGGGCSLSDVVASAKYLLRNGGKFYLVMRAKRTAELFALLSEYNVRPKRMQVIHPRPGGRSTVVLVEAVRDAGDGLVIEPPIFMRGPDGYTDELLEAYRLDNEGEQCLL